MGEGGYRVAINLRYVIHHPEAMGITQKSLKNLRDAIAQKLDHQIAVIEVPTTDECCGFMIFDRKDRSATFTGEGFRLDECGEGGAGYKTAKALFRIFGIEYTRWEPVDFDPYIDINLRCAWDFPSRARRDEDAYQWVSKLAVDIAATIPESEYKKPIDSNPDYLRGLV